MNDLGPAPGAVVRVRQRTYLVQSLEQPPADDPLASPVVQLACIDDDALGQSLTVAWAAELDAQVLPIGASRLSTSGKPDDPRTFAAYIHALRWGCVTSTDPTLFQSPLRAGIVPKTYQLEPLRKALSLPRVNLFIADDVGLGKTIEAGLILQELLLRQRVDRVVIAAPATVLLQWRDELKQRFGLTFAVLDRSYVNARRRERGFAVNPWRTGRFFLISHNLVRDETYLGPLRDWLGERAPRSLLILDEAHAAAPSSASKYAVPSETTNAIRDLSRRFEHKLFLSATPHNGHENSFSALLELLDAYRFTRGVPVTDAARDAVLVRRLKRDLKAVHAGEQIPDRVVEPILISDSPEEAPELVLAEKLATYSDRLEEASRGRNGKQRGAARLITIHLQTRLLSSVEAFARSLTKHRAWLRDNPIPAEQQPGLFGDLDDNDESLDELAQASSAIRELPSQTADELLEDMERVADEERGKPDAKLRKLIGWIRDNQCPDLGGKGKGEWTAKRVIIFTEWDATRAYLKEQLSALVLPTDRGDERIMEIHGDVDEADRELVKAAFNAPAHPVRILIATDAAREGINLQGSCSDLFHFDLPWNPARLEQRNGRIDRVLQEAPVVHCRYFVYERRPEDAVLKALVVKSEVIKEQLGSLAAVVHDELHAALKDGISRHDAGEQIARINAAGKSRKQPETLRAEDEEKLRKGLERLRTLYNKALEQVGGTGGRLEARLQSVVDEGLVLAGVPRLAGAASPPHSFRLELPERLATDPAWTEVLDTLRKPQTKRQPTLEWRHENPPRPLSFAPATSLASETVQIHLHHKLTQRALAQFRAQAFGEDGLARVAMIRDPTYAQRRVIAFGRLSVYGRGASRLHEELIAVGAIWTEGTDPKRLKPFAEDGTAADRAMDALSSVLERDDSQELEPDVVRLLMQHAQADDEALWKTLQARGMERRRWAEGKLAERSEKEAKELKNIIEQQQLAIGKELKRREQLSLDFGPDEAEQRRSYERDGVFIKERRTTIANEMETAQDSIRELYDVVDHRLERIGLVYLWPDRG